MTKNKFVRYQREIKVLEPGAVSPECACCNYLMWREFFDMSGARIFDLLVDFYRYYANLRQNGLAGSLQRRGRKTGNAGVMNDDRVPKSL
jgi:hypothetical protein